MEENDNEFEEPAEEFFVAEPTDDFIGEPFTW